MLVDANGFEAVPRALFGKRVRLRARPAVARVPVRARFALTFEGDEATARREHPAELAEAGVDVLPVVNGRDRPCDLDRSVRERELLGGAVEVADSATTCEDAGDAQHHRRRVDADDSRAERRRMTGRGARPAADVEDRDTVGDTTKVGGEFGVGFATEREEHGHRESEEPAESGEVGVMIGNASCFIHAWTLTVEPKFKSSSEVKKTETLLTIGEVAERAGVATSAVRYYERRGLLDADTRQSGQRRYREESLRRLVFIGMLQDAGLTLDDIEGILNAPNVAAWKAIARERLTELDEEIERLENARAYLMGALLCRYDHPATECKHMGAEIDRRLSAPIA